MTTPREVDLRRIESEIAVLLRRVKRVLGERAVTIHPDLSAASYVLLGEIMDAGPLRSADLVGTFGIDKGVVSRSVQHLVDLDLVERQPDPDDRRAQLLAATAHARKQMTALQRRRSARFEERLSGWSDTDVSGFAENLADYNQLLAED